MVHIITRIGTQNAIMKSLSNTGNALPAKLTFQNSTLCLMTIRARLRPVK